MSPCPPVPEAAPQIALPWIIRLRYGMVAGQIGTALVVQYLLKIDLPLRWIAVGPLLVGCSNLLLAARASETEFCHRITTSTLVAWAFVLDTLCLTFMLMLSGGPTNPFSLLYLVHITLSAIILTKRWTWALGALSTLVSASCSGSTGPSRAGNAPPEPMARISTSRHVDRLRRRRLSSSPFLRKDIRTVASSRRILLRMQIELAKKRSLASLGTLAAGAAHEFNTPLGTIALIARELELFATRNTMPSPKTVA